MSGQLVPFGCYSFDGMVCNELGLYKELASSDITQFECVTKTDSCINTKLDIAES